jgi:DNA polymerase III delta subunit
MLNRQELLKDLHEDLITLLITEKISNIKRNYFIINNNLKIRIAHHYEIDENDMIRYIEIKFHNNILKFSTVVHFLKWFNRFYKRS